MLDSGNRWALSLFSFSEYMKLSGMRKGTFLATRGLVNERVMQSGVPPTLGSDRQSLIGNKCAAECHSFRAMMQRRNGTMEHYTLTSAWTGSFLSR
jgi:hypothetical protein